MVNLKKKNVVREKSYKFALRIIKLCKYLKVEKKEFVLSNQIIKSGTSIGANIEEAIGGHTKKDFLNKLTIAYKEARETDYWIRLLNDSGFISNTQFTSLINDCEEILKLLGSIQKTLKAGGADEIYE